MTYQLPKLPYEKNALAPFMSEETFTYHYGKHHKAYIDKLNSLIPGTPYESLTMEQMIPRAIEGGRKDIFNQAAQSYNHTFFWYSMTPKGNSDALRSNKGLVEAINAAFGSVDGLKEKFQSTGIGTFGSGWVWLARDQKGALSLHGLSNAETPFMNNPAVTPILVCDVWEHAYYIDFRNDRAKFLAQFWDHIDWNFVSERYNDGKLWEASKLMKA